MQVKDIPSEGAKYLPLDTQVINPKAVFKT